MALRGALEELSAPGGPATEVESCKSLFFFFLGRRFLLRRRRLADQKKCTEFGEKSTTAAHGCACSEYDALGKVRTIT